MIKPDNCTHNLVNIPNSAATHCLRCNKPFGYNATMRLFKANNININNGFPIINDSTVMLMLNGFYLVGDAHNNTFSVCLGKECFGEFTNAVDTINIMNKISKLKAFL